MSALRELNEEQAAVKVRIDQLVSFDVETIRRRNEMGNAFDAPSEAALAIITFSKHIPPGALTWMDTGTARECTQLFNETLSTFKNTASTPREGAKEARRLLDGCYQRLLKTWAPIFSVSRFIDGWPEEDAIRASAKDIPAAIEAAQGAAAACRERESAVAAVEARMRAQLGEFSLGTQSRVFETAALGHSRAAACWFGAALVLGVALVLSVFDAMKWHHLFPTPDVDASAGAALQATAARMLVYVTISTFLVVALRQFSAEKHNVIVNRHRANALAIYGPLMEVSDEPRVRDIILTHAASSIFAPQPTGLSRATAPESDNASASAIVAALSQRDRANHV